MVNSVCIILTIGQGLFVFTIPLCILFEENMFCSPLLQDSRYRTFRYWVNIFLTSLRYPRVYDITISSRPLVQVYFSKNQDQELLDLTYLLKVISTGICQCINNQWRRRIKSPLIKLAVSWKLQHMLCLFRRVKKKVLKLLEKNILLIFSNNISSWITEPCLRNQVLVMLTLIRSLKMKINQR